MAANYENLAITSARSATHRLPQQKSLRHRHHGRLEKMKRNNISLAIDMLLLAGVLWMIYQLLR